MPVVLVVNVYLEDNFSWSKILDVMSHECSGEHAAGKYEFRRIPRFQNGGVRMPHVMFSGSS